MWKRFHGIVIVLGSTIGGVIAWLSTNSIPDTLNKADGFLGTNLRWLGWAAPPSTLASSVTDHRGIIVACCFFALSAIAFFSWVLEKLLHDSTNFEKVETWSVSMSFPGWGSGTLETGERYFYIKAELNNLSASQARILELSVLLYNSDNPQKAFRLSSENTGRRPYFESLKRLGVSQGQLDELIQTPVSLQPNSAIKGQIEFRVHGHQHELFSSGNVNVREVKVRDRRSRHDITLQSGYVYDAKRQKSYRGEIGLPYNSIRFKLWQYKFNKRNKGKGVMLHAVSKWS